VPCRHDTTSFLLGPSTTHDTTACLRVVPAQVRPSRYDYLRPYKNTTFGGPIRRTREGGSEWEPIKILLEGDRGSNKMKTTSNKRLRLNYLCWSRPRSHWSATDPRNQETTFRAKTHQHTHRKLARLAACATPV
jgi:hypothetical protein